MIFHNLKVAVRNLMKYKLQTIISVLSIAIGIVTLALTHSILGNFKLPPINDEPYYDRAYIMQIKSLGDKENEFEDFSADMIKVLKADGGLKNAEKIVFSNYLRMRMQVEFHLADSTVRKGEMAGYIIDPEYPAYAGLRSALTGKKIKRLKNGEAIVSEEYAKTIFQDKNPIGAIQTEISEGQPIPVKIVDIYRSLPLNCRMIGNDALYFSLTDKVEELASNRNFLSYSPEVILKEEKSVGQLQKEVEQRLKPWNVGVELHKVSDRTDDGAVITIRLIIYLIGCLILVAAIIGFLRMHVQLVRLRSREISLRMVNGASPSGLFTLLMVEIGIVLSISVLVAVVLGILLKDFIFTALGGFLDEIGASVRDMWPVSLAVGVGVLVLCGLIVDLVLHRMYRSRQGLAVHMRGGRNHLFRNMMLGIQIAICFVFVCSSFILVYAGEKIKYAYFFPANDDFLKECLSLTFETGVDSNRLYDEIKKLPCLDRIVVNCQGYYPIKELLEASPEIKEEIPNRTHLMTYRTNDTALLDVLGIDVDWIDGNVDRLECLLMQEELYEKLNRSGIIVNNSLTIQRYGMPDVSVPIVGTFRHIPYEQDRSPIIFISADMEGEPIREYMLLPKPGKAKSLERDINEVIGRFAPETIGKMVFNYREKVNLVPGMVETAVKGGWILGCVSLLICVMGIFSTITLDTRARKKEVAIRKVNGAKSGDIYRMFGKVYAWLILLSLVVAIPVSVLFGKMINTLLVEIDAGLSTSFVWPIVLGCLVVIIFILGIVFWQIRRVMQVDPARIIAKE